MSRTKQKLTPPEIARLWGISPDKILGWIHSGELRAIDVATRRGGRPRYLVDVEELAAFEARRAATAFPPRGATVSKSPSASVTKYF
jgi:excisionase family DNA binding protein